MMRRKWSEPWVHTVYDLVLALVVAYSTPSYGQGYDTLIGFSMAAAVVFRRRRPMTVMAVVSALALAQYLLAASPGPLASEGAMYDMAVLIAMVTVVSHTEQIWKAYAAGGISVLGIVLVFGGMADFTTEAGRDGLDEALAVAGACAAVWVTSYMMRTRRLYVGVLEERAATAERERTHLAQIAAAEERAEIARELHDVVAHSLAVMIVQADGASYAIVADQDRARTAMQTIAGVGRDALEDMGRIVEVLRGTKGSDAEDGSDRRRVGLAHLEPLVERARVAGLQVELRIEGERQGLSAADELTLFRIAQESMTNALRHAGPSAQVSVALRFDDGTAVLEVVDDGAGRLAGSAPVVPGSGGNGLVGMRERVEVHGGRFTAGPRLGPGWQVRVELPVRTTA
ncbi:sensor histidine kinase [Streptomyces sp. NBC_00878]|uniref:sensor histidine kinase n=1 Tax=Streptomyces sp. NBC_00878 TaxID=2975854 RepID=UPI002256A563|nr:histidine kinase [Streptomyces sp. NBC_00878]MCX4908941.1 histidine kinase [Streptomyces sp. NBC_00878]